MFATKWCEKADKAQSTLKNINLKTKVKDGKFYATVTATVSNSANNKKCPLVMNKGDHFVMSLNTQQNAGFWALAESNNNDPLPKGTLKKKVLKKKVVKKLPKKQDENIKDNIALVKKMGTAKAAPKVAAKAFKFGEKNWNEQYESIVLANMEIFFDEGEAYFFADKKAEESYQQMHEANKELVQELYKEKNIWQEIKNASNIKASKTAVVDEDNKTMNKLEDKVLELFKHIKIKEDGATEISQVDKLRVFPSFVDEASKKNANIKAKYKQFKTASRDFLKNVNSKGSPFMLANASFYRWSGIEGGGHATKSDKYS